ncbi:MAG: MltA domain-containing protein [Planctomycetes bacterium]|nr:MltA domain-containing protein [Planctomycetota bacterium]
MHFLKTKTVDDSISDLHSFFIRRAGIFAAGLVVILFFTCCVAVKPPPEPTAKLDYARPLAPGEKALQRVSPEEYPDFSWGFTHRRELLKAVDESIAYLNKPSSRMHFPVEGITHERVQKSLDRFKEIVRASSSSKEFAQSIENEFEVYMSTGCDGRGTVLFTGYCEPIVPASLEETSRYRYPLYRLPDDLVKDSEGTTLGRRTSSGSMVPYYTREEIDEGQVLKGQGLELAWLEHPLDAFIIHVQGSASLRLPDGTLLKIGYAGKNGRPYNSLGQALVRDGKLGADEVSLDSIRRHFQGNPAELLPYLYQNESYIFFVEHEGGPYGSIGAEVTPYRTVATDKSVFPRASLTFLDTHLPTRDAKGQVGYKTYRGFALDQDTGGAIRSAGRVDVFMGTGSEAEFLAGRTKHEGKIYYLFLRDGA